MRQPKAKRALKEPDESLIGDDRQDFLVPHPSRIIDELPVVYSAPPNDIPDAGLTLSGDDQFVGLGGLSETKFTQDERDALIAPMADDDLDILPTGEVYPPQIVIRGRLNRVVGPGAWGLRPCSKATQLGNTLIQSWALMIRGNVVAFATGESDYHPANARMSWATAIEAAKSNALVRCCKDIGIGAECWDKRKIAKFKTAHCVSVQVRYRAIKSRSGGAATRSHCAGRSTDRRKGQKPVIAKNRP